MNSQKSKPKITHSASQEPEQSAFLFSEHFIEPMEIEYQGKQPSLASEKLRGVLASGGDRSKGQGQLMNRFLNSIISKAAQFMEENETCAYHKSEYLVAIDSDKKNLGCERCVYEGQQQDPKFISLFAREIKDDFDKEYYEFVKNQSGMEDLNPQVIIQNIKLMASQFFLTLRRSLDDMEQEVMRRIKESDTLKSLAQLLQDLNEDYDEILYELVEEEKKILDDKIDKSKFAFLVLKSRYYEELTEAMRELNRSIKGGISEGKQKYEQIISYKPDEEYIRQGLLDILNHCIRVDNHTVEVEEKKKEIKVQSREFIMQDNKILQVDTLNKRLFEIQQIKDLYMAKLLNIDQTHSLMIGGQSSLQYDRTTSIKRTCFSLKLRDGVWKSTSQASMIKPRVSFGATFIDKDKQFVLVSGGYGLTRTVLSECEILNVRDNHWKEIGKMKTARASHTLFATDGAKFVYAFGGLNEKGQPITSIERTKLDNPEGQGQFIWEEVNLKINEPLLAVGVLQISLKEILLVGGLDRVGDRKKQGKIIMIENEERGQFMILDQGLNLEQEDSFSNIITVKKSEDQWLVFGNQWVHELQLKPERKFMKYMRLQ